ncbi:MAG: T9SS type A sorting domain-containing protein [Saprospiraceae bacterium]|nr:T9SS type A sorting domain-containing protein [Saprospiraceae bacterium]
MAFWTSICTVNAQTDFCSKARLIQCGQTVSFNNFDTGNILQAQNYGSCLSGVNTSINPFNSCEVVYRVDVPANSSLTVSLAGMSKDLDLFIFRGCSANASCTAKSINPSNSNELININGASGTYYIVIDGSNNEQRSQFQLLVKCDNSCGGCGDDCPQPNNNCQDVAYKFVSNFNGVIRYNFSVPTSFPIGNWEIKYTTQVVRVQNARSVNVDYPSSGGATTVCYKYIDSRGCEISCCKTLCIVDPSNCNALSVTQSGNQYRFNLPGISAQNILEWRNDDTGELIAGSGSTSISYPVPPTGVCYNISVKYYDPSTGCYRICCKKICGNNCPPVDNNCDKINFSYSGSSGSLRYQFSVPNNIPSGRWFATGGNYGANETTLGNGYTIDFTFPAFGTYNICYEYTDQNGCKVRCCRQVCINDPFACDRIIVNPTQGGFNLSLSGVLASNVIRWTNDTNGANLGSGVTNIFVALPPAGKCYLISALIYDPVTRCYQICCKRICAPAHPCGEITDIDVVCENDPKFANVTFTLNNTYDIYTNPIYDATASNLEIDFILVSPSGIGFRGCNNVTKLSGIISGPQTIILRLEGCALPLTAGTKIMVMPVLKRRTGDYTAVCCHLDMVEIVIPSCDEACVGESSGETLCTLEYNPVCGCNNQTYDNPCAARIAGVKSWRTGTCNGSNLADGSNVENRGNTSEQEVLYTLTNSPNPFSGFTVIKFSLPARMKATLSVLDMDGKVLYEKTGEFEEGTNELEFDDTSNLPSGMYFYRLQTEDKVITKSMILSEE